MIAIVDCSYMLHRSYSIFVDKMFGRPDTEDGFDQLIYKVFADITSTLNRLTSLKYVIFAFDGTSWRKSYYEQYKANRHRMPDSYYLLELYLELSLRSFGCAVMKSKDAEADDIVYICSTMFEQDGVTIISCDKDLIQCLNKNVIMWDGRATNSRVFAVDESQRYKLFPIKSEYELVLVDPMKELIVKILIGDKGDNVPGIASKFGEVKARKVAESSIAIDAEDLCKKVALMKFKNEDILQNINRNIMLVSINEMPTSVAEQIEQDLIACPISCRLFGENELYNTYKELKRNE